MRAAMPCRRPESTTLRGLQDSLVRSGWAAQGTLLSRSAAVAAPISQWEPE
jgi:hypothetical protein